MPSVLNVTFTGSYTDSFQIAYNVAANDWVGTGSILCGTAASNWALKCVLIGQSYVWSFSGDALPGDGCGTPLINNPTSAVCSPFQLTFNMTGLGGTPPTCCNGVSWTATITA